ncbi:hypothetical protein BDB01DRAFT_832289 [Pilobolus umbonatus]|nr:hypothetical protein BDB01DRAFT_832289 [Pilobolus umbonatus]
MDSNETLFYDESITSGKRKERVEAVKEEELLVYGYEARVFRDDTIAKDIENGKYLIPWRSDNAYYDYKLDRYDVRHLVDSKSDFDVSEAALLEREYDDERYADLDYTKEYNTENGIDWIVIEMLIIIMMNPPLTREQLSIQLEVSKQIGSSKNANLEEIRIQAKNGNNPYYSFLNKRDPLYPFYKHLLWISNSGLNMYGDSSDSEEEEVSSRVTGSDPIMPPDDILSIIMKTAEYVSKAGDQLEDHIRNKKLGDPKFQFLDPSHSYYSYFRAKVDQFNSQK